MKKNKWKKYLALTMLGLGVFANNQTVAAPTAAVGNPSSTIYISGHKNPDMDSIGSSIGYAALKRAQGMDAVAIRPGELNKEAQFALDYFQVQEPQLVTRVAEKQPLILIDHNEAAHAVDGMEQADIIEIVDHHRLGGLLLPNPISVTIRPVGCTGTIVASLYDQNDVKIPKDVAGMLLSAIISDTVLFKSPTCTELDKKTAKKLARIAGVNVKDYGMAMLRAGIDFQSLTPEQIVRNDSKVFYFGTYKAIIASVSTADNYELLTRKPELTAAMRDMCAKEGFDLAFLMVVDIMSGATDLVFVGEPRELVAQAFGQDASGDSMYLPGVMSRKQQIVPPLTEAAAKLNK